MKAKPHPAARIAGLLILLGFAALIIWSVSRPPRPPSSPRIEQFKEASEIHAARERNQRDARLVRLLIDEDLGSRRFHFATVIGASSGCKVLPLEQEKPSHLRVTQAITTAIKQAELELAMPGSEALKERRINEVSRHFEDFLQQQLDQVEGLRCGIPKNRAGEHQRSGYPDLEIIDEETGDVFYLDPKLVENDSWKSSFRTFYFEPKEESLKITSDAVHLLLGIAHDGNHGAWKFGPSKLVDLSQLTLRLKPEFQASNADLYPDDDDQ